MSRPVLTLEQESALHMLKRAALFLDLAMNNAVRDHRETAEGNHILSLKEDQFDALDHAHGSVFEAFREVSKVFHGYYSIGAREAA